MLYSEKCEFQASIVAMTDMQKIQRRQVELLIGNIPIDKMQQLFSLRIDDPDSPENIAAYSDPGTSTARMHELKYLRDHHCIKFYCGIDL